MFLTFKASNILIFDKVNDKILLDHKKSDGQIIMESQAVKTDFPGSATYCQIFGI